MRYEVIEQHKKGIEPAVNDNKVKPLGLLA